MDSSHPAALATEGGGSRRPRISGSLTDIKVLLVGLKGGPFVANLGDTVKEEVSESEGSRRERNWEGTARFNDLSQKLTNAHGLVMILPWPLLHRARFYPDPSSVEMVMSGWDKAPSGDGVTIVFTFIKHMKELEDWQEKQGVSFVDDMILAYHTQVRMEVIDAGGYLVQECERGNFVCAFSTPVAAMTFALKLQENSMDVDWSPEVLATQWACEQFAVDCSISFRGPRTAIGMSTASATRVQTCDRTGRMEYFGPVMNHSARVATAASGGQVLVDQSTCSSLLVAGSQNQSGILKGTIFVDMGHHQLKGITTRTRIFQASTPRFSSRTFPSIKCK